MIIYEGNKSSFLQSVINDTIANEIRENILIKMKRQTPSNEFRSWENSMQYMYKVLSDTEIPNDAGVAIEYNIPQTSKRVDFLISGYDNNDVGNVVIIELKQWDKITAIDGKDALVETYTGGALRQVVHPSYQAWSYASLIKDYNETVQINDIALAPCAYLHNYVRTHNDPIDAPQYDLYTVDTPVFTRGQVDLLRAFIKKCIVTGDNENLLYKIDNGRIKPSKSLQDAISNMVKGNQEFIMIDDQKVVYENIIDLANESKHDNKKRVIIVQGGPGTGKTVVAVNLLSALTNQDHFCQYVSKNSAPRNVYSAKLKGTIKKSSVNNMFKGSGIYTDAATNIIDTILVDEAHRLNAKSGMFKNMGENQIKEIINAGKCSVFFIDENQRVTLDDIGSIGEIEKWANYHNATVYYYGLKSQFRCNGSDGYLAWVDNALQIRETANFNMDGLNYDLQIVDDPSELRDIIVNKNLENGKSRILAGYCWNWITSGKNDSSVHDIVIGDFEMSWNLGNTSTFAIDDTSINEIGCIHTSQGLEFDYVGVIIGNDLRYKDGKVITDFTSRASTDKSLFGIKGMYKQNPEAALQKADEIIKNTYRTLLTRGMKGCVIYCTDKALSDYLKGLI